MAAHRAVARKEEQRRSAGHGDWIEADLIASALRGLLTCMACTAEAYWTLEAAIEQGGRPIPLIYYIPANANRPASDRESERQKAWG
jgi:hypothetical protein